MCGAGGGETERETEGEGGLMRRGGNLEGGEERVAEKRGRREGWWCREERAGRRQALAGSVLVCVWCCGVSERGKEEGRRRRRKVVGGSECACVW